MNPQREGEAAWRQMGGGYRRFTREERRSPARLEQLMAYLARQEGRPYVPGSSRSLNLTEEQWLELEQAVRVAGHPRTNDDRQPPRDAPAHESSDGPYDGGVNTDDEMSAEEEEGQAEVSGLGGEEAAVEEDDAMSDTSSAMYDPEADPDAYARRLDELAGVLEMGEQEARAMRWGISFDKKAPMLSIADFKTFINHHLDATEWKYASDSSVPDIVSGARSTGGTGFEQHPIWVMGPDRADEAEDGTTAIPGSQLDRIV